MLQRTLCSCSCSRSALAQRPLPRVLFFASHRFAAVCAMPLDTDQPCHQMHAKLESCDAQQRHWPRCARTKIAAEIAAAARIVLGPSKPAVTTIRHGFSPLRCFPTFSRVHMGVMYRCQRLPCPLAPASYTRGSYHGILPAVIIENIIYNLKLGRPKMSSV